MPITDTPEAKNYLYRLRQEVCDEKVSHCIFTAEYLASFAVSLGIDHDDAVAAGLLHDFCRDLSADDMLERARQCRLPLSDVQLEAPTLLHGPLAAEVCRSEFGINDAVYQAVYWHTTGRPALELLGQALYVADFAEPTRKFPEAVEARTRLRKNGFDAALLYVAEMKAAFSRKKKVVDPNTQAFLLWLKTRNQG